ncbi:MAG TPA: hypothetical protein VMB23_03440 [Spirochaetia bacterium]|nr:hypothetical protein [Spirochaetia bacterium]
MKFRILGAVGLALCLGTGAFADGGITFGGWGRAVVVPAMGAFGTDNGISETLGASWQTSPRVGFDVHGQSANLGFDLGIDADNGSISYNGAHVWYKPIKQVLISLGDAGYADLRGNGVFGSFDWLRPLQLAGEDLTFQQAGKSAAFNTVISTELFDHLKAFVDVQAGHTYSQALKDMVCGAGYSFGGLGQVRVQYIGSDTEGGAQVNGMVEVSAIPNLTVDLGVFYPLDPTVLGNNLKFGGYTKYVLARATLHALGFYEAPKDLDPRQEVGAGIDLDLGSSLTVSSDYRWQNQARLLATQSSLTMLRWAQSAFVGINLAYPNGQAGIGLEYCSTTFTQASWYSDAIKDGRFTDDPKVAHWAIPVRIDYWF